MMRLGRRFGWSVGAVMAATAVAAAACGGTSYSTKSATAPAGTPAAASAPAESAASPTSAATSASGTTAGATVNISTSGTQRFVDANGMSLYVFKSDTAGSGTSACNNGCAVNWPALTVPAGTTPTAGQGVDGLGTITRDDGTTQVTYDGLPLYRYAADRAPGDENGKNVPNWALATPS